MGCGHVTRCVDRPWYEVVVVVVVVVAAAAAVVVVVVVECCCFLIIIIVGSPLPRPCQIFITKKISKWIPSWKP